MAEPTNLPKVGDRVKARGKELYGVLIYKSVHEPNWVHVNWDGDLPPGPRVCHLHELEKVSE